jgi:kynurenine formamidase
MCGPGIVSAEDRERIAAFSATVRTATKSPFGPDDQIGMLNLMTRDSVREVLAEVDAHKVIDLAVDYFIGMPSWAAAGDPTYQIWMTHTPRGSVIDDLAGVGETQNRLVSYSGDSVLMYTHCGTHVDTLNHFGYHGKVWNGFSVDEHLGSRHWTVSGADKHPPIVARGVLIDVAGAQGVECLPDSFGIGEAELRDALRRQKTELRVGDVVMIRTGRMTVWPDAQRYLAPEPGLNREGAEYLAKCGAMLIGADNIALEQYPSAEEGNWDSVHTYLLAEAGIPIVEVVDLEALAADRLYTFAFLGACLKLRGATGSPMRPMALPLRSSL